MTDLTSLNQSASLGHHSIVPLPITLKDSQPFGDRREEAETLAEPHVDQPAQQQLELPRDRPFANLTPAALVPSNYATIMQAQVDPKEKAKRLKAALLRDNLQLGAYFLMLAAMGSLAFFQAAKGNQIIELDSCKKPFTDLTLGKTLC